MKLFFKSIAYSFSLLYKSSKYLFAVYWLSALINSTLTMGSTVVTKYILEILSQDNPDLKLALSLLCIYIAVLLISCGIDRVNALLYDLIFTKGREQYEEDVLNKMKQLPVSFIDSSKGKDTVVDVRYSTVAAVHLADNIVRIVTYLYTFTITFTTLARFSLPFSILFLILTLAPIIARNINAKKSEELRRKQAPDMRKFCYYRWILTDPWPAKDVRMYDLTEPIKARYTEVKNEYLKANKRLDKKRLKSMLLSELIQRSGEILFTIFVVWKAVRSEISIGDITLYIGFALSASSAFSCALDVVIFGYTRTSRMMGRVFEFFAIPTECTQGTRELDAFESLEFQNVCFKYPYTEKDVLKGVSFTLNKGDKLSLVGINGSGKSTIIKLMLGLYEINSGKILINGYSMDEYDIRDVRKLFSALFQSFVQYPLTLRENIALSDYDRASDDDAIISSIKQSGVYDELQEKLENGLESYMTRQFDDKGTELSKGQWQKIALSRAYFKNAEIFIFDEPSATLDAEAEDKIFKNFESISEGKTGIMISHRISAARMSNKILVLDGGIITENGTHDELIAANGLYAKFYNLQKEKYMAKESV